MPPACRASPAIQGQKEVTGGVRQELPCSSGVRQTATLAHTPGSCHAACTHRFLCKPPHETSVRLIRTVCHELILPDVNKGYFPRRNQSSQMVQMQVGLDNWKRACISAFVRGAAQMTLDSCFSTLSSSGVRTPGPRCRSLLGSFPMTHRPATSPWPTGQCAWSSANVHT